MCHDKHRLIDINYMYINLSYCIGVESFALASRVSEWHNTATDRNCIGPVFHCLLFTITAA